MYLCVSGGVFRDPDSHAHVAFKYAVNVHNNRTDSEMRVSVQVKPVASTTDAYTFISGGKAACFLV